MDNYVVSARKYRPTNFDDVIGQDHVTTTLKNAIQNKKVAQSLLFCGPRGVGKTTCARIVAKMVNNLEWNDPLKNNNDLNIYELDAASNNSVDDIRNLIEQVRYAPQSGKFKVYIIDEVHMLSNAAFNAFLKTLEEPPSYAVFILATTEKNKVIPTILSRCQIHDFNRIEIDDIKNRLKKISELEGISTEDDALHIIAQKSDGALRDALSILDLMISYATEKKITYDDVIKNLNILDYDYFFKITDFILKNDSSSCFLILDEILKLGFESKHFITGLAEHFRNLLLCKDESVSKLIEVSDGIQSKYSTQSQKISNEITFNALDILNSFDINYNLSSNKRLHAEIVIAKLCRLKKTPQVVSKDIPKKKIEKKPEDIESKIEDTKKAENIKKEKEDTLKSSESTKKDSDSDENDQKDSLKINESIINEQSDSIKKNETLVNKSIQKKTIIKNTPDLNSILNGESKNEVTKDEEAKINSNKNQKIEEFDEKSLKSFIKEYIKLKNISNSKLSVLNKEFLIDNNKINIKVGSDLENEIFEDLKNDLLLKIKEHFKNQEIEFKISIDKKEKSKKLYTGKEKFEFLMKNNKEIKNLKNQFNLDYEF